MSDKSPAETEFPDSELLEKAQQLLVLTDLVEAYPDVVARRVNGILYLIIGGGMSFVTLIFMSLLLFVEFPGQNLLIITAFVILSLVIAWFLSFRLIRPLTESYPIDIQEEMSTLLKVVWGILTTAMVVSAVVLFSIGQVFVFAVVLQLLLFIGNSVNYYDSTRGSESDSFRRVHLYYSLLIALGLVPMFLFPPMAFVFLIVINLGGLYAIGIYALLSAERLLLEKTRR